LAGQGPFLIDAFFGVTIDEFACAGEQAMLQHIRLTAPEIARMRADFPAISPTFSLPEQVDVAGRSMYLDTAARLSGDGLDAISVCVEVEWAAPTLPTSTLFGKVAVAAIDRNQVLRMGNTWYDRMAEACRKPTHIQRKAAIEKINDDLRTAMVAQGWRLSLLLSPRDGLSRWIGLDLLAVLAGGIPHVADVEDRAATQFELTKLGFALAAYRAEQGSYPAKLAELSPKYVPEVPQDPFNEQPLHYTRQGDGYLLYSVGVNGKDDGGKGAADCKEGEGWDDLAIHVPAETAKK
jgi:hypothetical protein